MSCTYSEIQAFHCNSISLHLTFVGLDYQFSPKDMVAQKAQLTKIFPFTNIHTNITNYNTIDTTKSYKNNYP